MTRMVLATLAILLMAGCAKRMADGTWDRVFGGPHEDIGFSVKQTFDGGYIIAGKTESYGAGASDIWLIKTDAVGNKMWDKTFGGPDLDFGYSVQQTSDGGYIVTGCVDYQGGSSGDACLIKTDAAGSEVWRRTFGGAGWDGGRSVQQTSDGGYVIAGWTTSDSSFGDVWLIKTDTAGHKVWDRTFGGNGSSTGNSVQQTADGGYIVTGTTTTYSGSGEVWLIKTDTAGRKVWDKTFGGSGPSVGNSVQQTSDGGYIVAGLTFSTGSGPFGSFDIWVIKTDASGSEVWDRSFGGAGWDEGRSARQTSDGGYVIVGSFVPGGSSWADVWLMQTDAHGSTVWDTTFGTESGDGGRSVEQTFDGGYIITGSTYPPGAGTSDVWLIKIARP